MGRDSGRPGERASDSDFNPLSPHGERQDVLRAATAQPAFQSTLPAWGETHQRDADLYQAGISIHSPRMGRDDVRAAYHTLNYNFNPLSPHGERHRLKVVAV